MLKLSWLEFLSVLEPAGRVPSVPTSCSLTMSPGNQRLSAKATTETGTLESFSSRRCAVTVISPKPPAVLQRRRSLQRPPASLPRTSIETPPNKAKRQRLSIRFFI